MVELNGRSVLTLSVVASALGACSSPSFGAENERECSSGAMELQETAALPLPAGFHVRQAAMRSNGDILVWGAQPPLIVLGRSGELDSLQLPPQTSIAAARWLRGGGVAVLDRWSWSEFILDPSGQVIRRVRFPQILDGRVTSVDAYGDGWAVGVVDPGMRRYSIYHLTRGEQAKELATIAIPREHRGRPNLLLRTTPSAILVTTPVAPFRSWAVDDGGGVVPFEPVQGSDLATSISAAPARQWRALAAVEIDCSYVVSLADLASDDRAFAVFSRGGTLLRISHLAAPFGLVATAESQVALAYRRASDPEVVLYEW